MSEIIYKPYSTISKEWESLCKKFTIARDNLFSLQNPFLAKYPDDELWDKYISAQDAFNSIFKEMEEYRRIVRIAD